MRAISFSIVGLLFAANVTAESEGWEVDALNVASGEVGTYQYGLWRRPSSTTDLMLKCYFYQRESIESAEIKPLEEYCLEKLKELRGAKVLSVDTKVSNDGLRYKMEAVVYGKSVR